MPKRISAAAEATAVRVVVLTLNGHVACAVAGAELQLRSDIPGLSIGFHAATDWDRDPSALERCREDIASGDVILVNMMFLEPHIQAVMPSLVARRPHCDAMACFMSGAEVVRLTKLGRFSMDKPSGGLVSMLKRLRGKSGKGGAPADSEAGARQMAMLRRLPKILKYVPGTAQDVRAYFLAMQFWLAGSEENFAGMIRLLVGRYAEGPRGHLQGRLAPAAPVEYPDVGLYHPSLPGRFTTDLSKLPQPAAAKGTVGLLVMRSYVLSGDTGHYDGVIAALEARGLRVIPAFASGLDSRAAARRYFMDDGGVQQGPRHGQHDGVLNGSRATIDALVGLTGFSLVGGPAYNDAAAAETMLAELDVPCLQAQAVEFQTVEDWRASDTGLSPVEATMMVAIPEIDGSTAPIVFGGRSRTAAPGGHRPMRADPERCDMLARRVLKQVALRRSTVAERRIAIVLFNFPPNAGAAGTAAYLSVFRSLWNTLRAMRHEGYTVDLPESVDALRERILGGNAARFGTAANVAVRIPAEEHVAKERHLAEIEAQWGPAPGRHQADGRSIFVLGADLGNVFVGLQPALGYEGDPMRLLFERGFAPTHAFSAFYRYLRDDFAAHAVLHFGMHGALEFMPGKQVGLTDACWPDRLIGDLPNVYLYAANNPSEGTIAKRRSGATLVSYLTPPVAEAGLYRGLVDLKHLLERWRGLAEGAEGEREQLAPAIQAGAAALDLAPAEPAWTGFSVDAVERLRQAVLELELTLIPHGLHVAGEAPSAAARIDLLAVMAGEDGPDRTAITAMVESGAAPADGPLAELGRLNALLAVDHEVPALLRALAGRFIRPAPGGDLVRTPAVLPTGRNLHGFDPFRIPSGFAVGEGTRQAELVLDRYLAETGKVPETVALVLWGTDNLKTEGGPIAQALALLGAKPRFDSFGRLCGAALIPLAEMNRPRIDVLITLSGIFRDLLPLQTRLLAEAAFLAASADEPEEANFVRKHALRYQEACGCDLETAALRVFSNADGAYGANVNLLVDSGAWQAEGELAAAFTARKCFAYDRSGRSSAKADLLKHALADVDLAYQNLDSVELGVTTVDHYFDALGGMSRAASGARGTSVPVFIADGTRGTAKVRTLSEQVALETRSRALNPKWYEAMLEHGYEGVRNIETQVTNTMGWSATTGQVDPWVYRRLAETFVLDDAMRARLASLNPVASARVANRLIEAQERAYWTPSSEELEALRAAGDELEDRVEGVTASDNALGVAA